MRLSGIKPATARNVPCYAEFHFDRGFVDFKSHNNVHKRAKMKVLRHYVISRYIPFYILSLSFVPPGQA